jgi:hypothetical protein
MTTNRPIRQLFEVFQAFVLIVTPSVRSDVKELCASAPNREFQR